MAGEDVLEAVGRVPHEPLPLRVESIGMFPGGVLFLGCVPSRQLLEEQRRARELVAPLGTGTWPFLAEGEWMPHITCAWDLSDDQFAQAASLAMTWLPIHG